MKEEKTLVKIRKRPKTLYDVMANVREKSDFNLSNITFSIDGNIFGIHFINGKSELHEAIYYNSERNFYSDNDKYKPMVEFEKHLHKVILGRFIKALITLKKR